MSSLISESGFSPFPPQPSVLREGSAPPCNFCEAPSHNTDGCPHAAAILMRDVRPNRSPICAHCKSSLHDTDICPHGGEDLAQRAAHLHDLEPYARVVLKTGVPRSAPCCDVHYEIDHVAISRAKGGILQHRALMPMCLPCVIERQDEFQIEHAAYRGSIDSCNCAALVFDDSVCQWCIVEQLRRRRISYEQTHRVAIQDLEGSKVLYLMCKCGRIPMGTPKDAASNTLAVREVMRLCAGCEGVVSVPLHHLDGEHHLACIPGNASQAIVGEKGLVTASVEGEVVGMPLDEECFAHPVRTVAQRPVYAMPKRKDAAVRSSGLRSGMEARSSASRGTRAHGGIRSRSTAMGEIESKPPVVGEARGLQQRPVPVARMVPVRPDGLQNDDRSISSSPLDLNFSFP